MTDKPRREPSRRDRETRYGPTRDEIDQALDEILSHNIPGTPPVWAIKVIKEASRFPLSVEDRRVIEAEIGDGRPRHGAMRSDDHVQSYVAAFDKDCPECNSNRAIYRYSAYHHISGSMSVTCRSCGYVHREEEWA